MAKNTTNTFALSAYSVWTSPFGTAAPTTPTTTPGAGWYEIGYLSDDGVGESRDVNNTVIYDAVGVTLRTLRSQEARTFTFAAREDNRVVRELRYPGSTVSSTGGTAEVQTVTISGTPSGGTFTLTGGQAGSAATTSPLAYNAAAAAVQTAVQGLPGLSGATVTGSAGGPYTITFTTALGDVPQLSASGAALTGGTSPGVTVVTTTPGVGATNTRNVGSGTALNRRGFLIYAADGTKQNMFVINNGEAVQTGDVSMVGNNTKVASFTVTCYPDANGYFFSLIDNDPSQSVSYS